MILHKSIWITTHHRLKYRTARGTGENIEEIVRDFGLGKEFLSMTPNIEILNEKESINSLQQNKKSVFCQRHAL